MWLAIRKTARAVLRIERWNSTENSKSISQVVLRRRFAALWNLCFLSLSQEPGPPLERRRSAALQGLPLSAGWPESRTLAPGGHICHSPGIIFIYITGTSQNTHQSGAISCTCRDHLHIEVKPLHWVHTHAIVKSLGPAPAITRLLLEGNASCQNPLAETQFLSPILIHDKVCNSCGTGIHK